MCTLKEPLMGVGPRAPVSQLIPDIETKLRGAFETLLLDREFMGACEKLPERFSRFLDDLRWRRETMVALAKE